MSSVSNIDIRPKGRMTPRAAFESRAKAMPRQPDPTYSRELRVRHDRVDQHGAVTIATRGSCITSA